jgi:hypothetical protein
LTQEYLVTIIDEKLYPEAIKLLGKVFIYLQRFKNIGEIFGKWNIIGLFAKKYE